MIIIKQFLKNKTVEPFFYIENIATSTSNV